MSEQTKRPATSEEQMDCLCESFNKYLKAMNEIIWSRNNAEVRAKLHHQNGIACKAFVGFMEVVHRSENKN